jgi:O-antigen ligase
VSGVTPRPRPLNLVQGKTAQTVGLPKERLGVPFLLLLVWIWFEYARPSNPMGIPLVISATLAIGWLMSKDRRWSRQSALLCAFLGIMAVGIPTATNTFSAFWSLYGMATVLLCIALPLPSVVTSVRKVRIVIMTFVVVTFYVGAWAIFNGGFGPSGAAGGQDENYVAAMMGMSIAFAYFTIFATKRWIVKLLCVVSILVSLAAVISANNVSRGGFLGICAALLYCLARSPRKWIGVIVLAAVAVGAFSFAPPAYWDEISSISDTTEGTADMRLEIWSIGIRMWRANPVFGVGGGNFRWLVGTYQSAEQLDKYGRDLGGSIIPHSLWVELLAELGAAGALVVLLLLWYTVRNLWQVVKSQIAVLRSHRTVRNRAAERDALALRCSADGTMGAIIACCVNGIFLSLLYYSYLWIFIMLGSAIWFVARSHTPAEAPASPIGQVALPSSDQGEKR